MREALFNGNGSVEHLVRVMRLLSDPTRLRLLGMLEEGERNVSSLCEELEAPQPTVSHHLALLRSAGLVCNRRSGKQVYYCLNAQTVARLTVPAGGSALAISAGPTELRLQPMAGNGNHGSYRVAVG